METLIKMFRGYPCQLAMSKMHVFTSKYGYMLHMASPYYGLIKSRVKKYRDGGLYAKVSSQSHSPDLRFSPFIQPFSLFVIPYLLKPVTG